MRHPRPILSPVGRPGWRALAGVLAGVAVLFIGLGVPGPPGSEVVWIVAGVLTIMLGAHLDRRARTAQLVRELAAHAFEPCDPRLLDPGVVDAARAMRPWTLPDRGRRLLLTGEFRGRTVWIALYQIQVGKSSVSMNFIAVQTIRLWPNAIIRRKGILDQLRPGLDLGHRAFDAQREMRSDDPQALMVFAPLADWFVTDDTVRRSFRLHEIPGKGEQWSFREHWATLAVPGRANARDLLRLVELVTAFAEQADEQPLDDAGSSVDTAGEA